MSLPPEESLGFQINLLARLFERSLRQAIADLGVVPGQFPALLALYAEDGLTQTQLSRRVQIEQPTMANTLQRMERDGLVCRAPDPDDRRRTHIHLTPRAIALQEPLAAAARDINLAATAGLAASERKTLLPQIARCIDALEAMTESP